MTAKGVLEVLPAGEEHREVLRNLMALYLHDFSEYNPEDPAESDVDDHGRFTFEKFDLYWTEPERHPFLFRYDGKWAGFALVRAGEPNQMAEFFVMRKYRRRGVGIAAARTLFSRFPGTWTVSQVAANTDSVRFWHAAIPVPFTETDPYGVVDAGHPHQTFTIPAV